MKPHKHKDVIIQWADGATVQFKDFEGIWRNVSGNPYWEEQSEYRASIAEVEGKPVFEGDVLYGEGGIPCKVCINAAGRPVFTLHGLTQHMALPSSWSWNPPKPKTFTLNGMELPLPNVSDRSLHCNSNQWSLTIRAFNKGEYENGIECAFASRAERDQVQQAIINLLEGK